MSNNHHSAKATINPAFSADNLLAWYSLNQRDLPWRRLVRDPYAVWVSEIMLQQTQVATVIPYFERWMKRFPTVQSLSEASLDDVLAHWSGLGYYARARNLRNAAQIVVSTHGGKIPLDAQTLLSLPGIGRYTTGAILSIAFNIPAPIVDGNVARVLTRYYTIDGDPKSGPVKSELWRLAEQLVPRAHASEFNQAVMELGALVCTPFEPSCDTCPLLLGCAGANSTDPTAWPQTAPGKKMIKESHVSVILMGGSQTLLRQRPPHGLWGGLWEFPRLVCHAGETREACAQRVVDTYIGNTVHLAKEFHTVRHTVTHHNIQLYGFEITSQPGATDCHPVDPCVHWVQWQAINNYPLSAPQTLLALKAAEIQSQKKGST